MTADLLDYYTNRYDEAQRLDSNLRGQLERIRLREVLSQYLPASGAAIADIGGGTGAHSVWLKGLGYRVWLLDPVPRHVDAALEAGVAALEGDARMLPWPDGCFDVALLAGPLYHLTDQADRVQTLREALRVVRPGGVVAALAHSRHTNLVGATLANQLLRRRRVVEEIATDGHSPNNDRLPPSSYYHRLGELHGELVDAGLTDVHLRGLTGPGGWLSVVVDVWTQHITSGSESYIINVTPTAMLEADPLETALHAARLADLDPEMTPFSSKLLAVGRRPAMQ